MKFLSYFKNYERINPNILVYIFYGILYETSYNIYRPFAVKYLERIGGTSLDISLFYSLPGLVAALALLPGSIILTKFKLKKNITSILFLISRLLILSMAFIAFLPAEIRPLIFIIIIGLINFPESLAQTSLQGFLGNVFSTADRSFAISLRNKFGNMTILIVTLLSGIIISYIPRNNEQRLALYQIFFAAAFISGLFEIFIFRRFKETPSETSVGHKLKIREIFQNKSFITYLLTTVLFQFSWQVGWPLTSIYYIEIIKASEIWFAIFACVSGLCSFFSAGFWNNFIIKNGNSKTLVLSTFCMAANMLVIGLSKDVWTITLSCVFTGFSVIGFNTTLLNGLLLNTPNHNRIMYLGVYNTFVNLSLFASPLVSAFLIQKYHIEISMFISAGLRFFAAFIILIQYRYSLRSIHI